MANSALTQLFTHKLKLPVVTEMKAFGSTSLPASTWTAVTDGTTAASVVITPSATTSKVLITGGINFVVGGTSGGSQVYFKLQRNGSDIKVGDAASSRIQATWVTPGRVASTAPLYNIAPFLLDSPASTSAQTYTLYAYIAGTTPNTITLYINEGVTNADASTNAVGYSQLAATEVLV